MEPMVAIARFKDPVSGVKRWAESRRRRSPVHGLASASASRSITSRSTSPVCSVEASVEKSKPDFIIEAAILAKEFPGKAVRVQWTT